MEENKKLRVAICAICKMENKYLAEWVDYHQFIGIDKFFLYDNNDPDGEHPEDVLKEAIADGSVEVIDVRGIKNYQVPAFDDCYQHRLKGFDWVVFIDIDEFITLCKHNTIQDYLNESIFNNFNTIFLKWEYYDDNGLIEVKNNVYSLLYRFKRKSLMSNIPVEFLMGKRCVRTGLPGVHINSSHGACRLSSPSESAKKIINESLNPCNSIGQPSKDLTHCFTEKPTAQLAYIRHFRYKTLQEYCETKLKRGYPIPYMNGGKALSLYEFFCTNKPTLDKLNWVIEHADRIDEANVEYAKRLKQAMLSGKSLEAVPKPYENAAFEGYETGAYETREPKVAVCAIAKLENHYVREWVEHHLKIGASKIYLYDNNDEKGERLEDVLSDYVASGEVEITDVRGKEKYQVQSFNDCYHKHADDADWIAFIDIDEFIFLDDGMTLGQFISNPAYYAANCVFLRWLYYDDNGLIEVKNGDYSVLGRFTRPCIALSAFDQNNCLGKRIVRTKVPSTNINSSHGPIVSSTPTDIITKEPILNQHIVCCNTLGKICYNDCYGLMHDDLTLAKAHIKHFRYKTLEEYAELKIRRGYPIEYLDGGKDLSFSHFFGVNQMTDEKLRWLREHGYDVSDSDWAYWKAQQPMIWRGAK